MLFSTLDLITRATSNDLYVFCFFNLIIAIIFMGSKQDQNSEIHFPSSANDWPDIEDEHSLGSSEQGTNASGVVLCLVSEERKASTEDCCAHNNSDSDGKESEGDDELTKRIEEFIAKGKSEWRQEMLKDI
ncbi:hypothetical protein PTKIN_Ptkin04bG0117100 [Pterospermum kingtungense]